MTWKSSHIQEHYKLNRNTPGLMTPSKTVKGRSLQISEVHKLYKEKSTSASDYSRNRPWKLLHVTAELRTGSKQDFLLYFFFWRSWPLAPSDPAFIYQWKSWSPAVFLAFSFVANIRAHQHSCSQGQPFKGTETHKTGFSWDKELEKDPLQNLALGIRFQSLTPPERGTDPESVWWVSESLSSQACSSAGLLGVTGRIHSQSCWMWQWENQVS